MGAFLDMVDQVRSFLNDPTIDIFIGNPAKSRNAQRRRVIFTRRNGTPEAGVDGHDFVLNDNIDIFIYDAKPSKTTPNVPDDDDNLSPNIEYLHIQVLRALKTVNAQITYNAYEYLGDDSDGSSINPRTAGIRQEITARFPPPTQPISIGTPVTVATASLYTGILYSPTGIANGPFYGPSGMLGP